MASEPLSTPIMPFAAVNPADAAIEPSAAFSFSFMLVWPRFLRRRMDQFYRFDNFSVRRPHNKERRVLSEGRGRSCPALLIIYPRNHVPMPPALRERNVRLREFVSCGEDSML